MAKNHSLPPIRNNEDEKEEIRETNKPFCVYTKADYCCAVPVTAAFAPDTSLSKSIRSRDQNGKFIISDCIIWTT